MSKDRVNHHQRAAIGWDALIIAAQNKEKATYKEFGEAIGIHHRAVRHVLGLIQDYCMTNEFPPLTILVVNRFGDVGDGFLAWDITNIPDGESKVFEYNWKEVPNPFEYARGGQTFEGIIDALVDKPEDSKDVFTLVRSRGNAQVIFREALLRAYEYKCSFCSTSWQDALQAAHIIPWNDCLPEQKMDVRNGILLCANHHKLFDAGVLTINSKYEIIHYDPEEIDEPYSEMDSILTTKLHLKKMKLPKLEKHRPNKNYLEEE